MSRLIEIRRLSEVDCHAYVSLRKEANSDKNYRGDRDPEKDLSLNEALRLLSAANTIVLGAFVDDELVAMVSLGWMAQNFSLVGLFVSQHYRRDGIGERLTLQLIGELKTLKARTIKLEVTRTNKAAIALYEKLGFTYLKRDRDTLKLILAID